MSVGNQARKLQSYPTDVGASATLIAHADRCWKSEEANATRHAARANLVLSAITAIVGFKLYALGNEIDVVRNAPFGFCCALFWFCLGLGLLLVGGAFTYLFDVFRPMPKENGQEAFDSASTSLRLPPQLVGSPWDAADYIVAWHVYRRTYNAYIDLQERNQRRSLRIDGSQKLLCLGLLALFMSIVMYHVVKAIGDHDEQLPALQSEHVMPTDAARRDSNQ